MALEFVSGFIVSSLLQELLDRIKASAADTIALAYSSNVEEELKALEASYVKAQSMLDNIDGWDLISSKPHRDWVADTRRACYDTEDFIEHLELEILKNKGDAGFFSCYWTKWGESSKIRDLQRNLNRLTGASSLPGSINHRIINHHHLAMNTVPDVVADDESFRRKQDKENIIRVLLDPTRSNIVLIAGMFGVGKTTLAQVVKNDSRIQHHFDHILWVSVSGDFDLAKALCSMILDLQAERIQEPNSVPSPFPKQQYVKLFRGLCKGRRVLIVLDDLCNFVMPQDWENFQYLLRDPSCLFGILVTTRNPKVATTVASLSSIDTVSYYLQRMSDEDCEFILQKKAVSAADKNPSKRLRCGRRITEVIAKKYCGGLPLVANIIGYYLLLERERIKPAKLPEDLWDMAEFKELIFPTFRLNYSDLSLFQKNCFPYFSLFPGDYTFEKEELVQLWLAEGYIKPHVAGVQSESSSLEEVGNYYFDDVLSQSILQIHHPFDQGPQIYRMHEFIHRYAQCIASDMYVQLDERFVGASSSDFATRYRNARHLSLLCQNILPPIWKYIERCCEGLRTILSLCEHVCVGQLSYTLFLKLQSLRVLNLSGTDISELPESVGKLKHLRLLDVSKTDIEELPASTTDLSKLQFLKADQCPLLLQLPKDIKNLNHLLHLEVDMKGLSSMPRNIGKLSNLRTLPAFIVGRKNGYRVTELKNMEYLQGSICLTDLENIQDEVEAKEAMLSKKPFLKRVELEWNRYSTDQSVVEGILGSLEPHENLEELQVAGYAGARFPSWLSSPECNLTSIHLLRCDRCSILPALGRLQHLKTLHIEEMHCVEYIDDSFSGSDVAAGFPSLELLKFQDMGGLMKWEGLQAAQMPCLRDLVITDCPKLIALPSLNALTSLVNLEISSCPVLQSLPEGELPLSLEKLIIVRSNLLKRCCLAEGGADWDKIKAVGKVEIDFVQMPTSARAS